MRHLLLAVILVLTASLKVYAIPTDFNAQVKSQQSSIKTPEDFVLNRFPLLKRLSQAFLLGDGFSMKLTRDELQIHHMAKNSKAPMSYRNCMVSFTYLTPVAGFFTSRIDIPLFNARTMTMEDWSSSSFGDYVAHFSKGASDHATIRLSLNARF